MIIILMIIDMLEIKIESMARQIRLKKIPIGDLTIVSKIINKHMIKLPHKKIKITKIKIIKKVKIFKWKEIRIMKHATMIMMYHITININIKYLLIKV